MMTRMQELGRLFWRSAKESGEAAAEAIEQRAQIQRLATNVRRLDKERSSLIRQIGSKVYSLHGQGKVRNQDVLTDCARIDEILVEIRKLQKEIEIVRAASLEKGIEVPVLSDEAPLDEEESAVATAVKPAGTFGEQTLPEDGPGRASDGRQEYDEDGDALMCDPGPSTLSDPRVCEVGKKGSAVKHEGMLGDEDEVANELPKSSEGRQEFDEDGDPLLCTTGPSTPADATVCEIAPGEEKKAD